jgi:hypothetical protein
MFTAMPEEVRSEVEEVGVWMEDVEVEVYESAILLGFAIDTRD